METLTVSKPGKTKKVLLDSLKNLLNQYKGELEDYNGEVTDITDGYKIKGSKFFFHLEADITADDGIYTIKYESNAPQHYQPCQVLRPDIPNAIWKF